MAAAATDELSSPTPATTRSPGSEEAATVAFDIRTLVREVTRNSAPAPASALMDCVRQPRYMVRESSKLTRAGQGRSCVILHQQSTQRLPPDAPAALPAA